MISLNRFLVFEIVFALILAGLSYAIFQFIPAMDFGTDHLIILFYFVFITGFAYYLITLSAGDSKNFITFYMSSIVMKLILTIIFTGVYIYLDRENASLNAAYIMACYLLFTLLEIIISRKLLKH